jgi:uncharacterized protein (TIRG00374 family)
MSRSRIIQLSISLIVGAACLYFAFSGVDLGEAWGAIKQVPWWGHVVYCLALFVQFIVRSFRWRIQVEGVFGSKPSVRDAFAVNAVAFSSVFLIPFRLGELVRPYISAQRGWMTASAGLAHSAVERILDGLVTTACFAIVLVLLGDKQLPPEVALGGWGALALFGGASLVLAIAYRYRAASERFWTRLIGLVHEGLAAKLVGMLVAFLDGLKCFKDLKAFLAYGGYTAFFWFWNGFAMWLMMRFMGIDVGPIAGFFTVCFLVIGVMIPAPPGNVGNFHYFAKLGLTLLGVSETAGLAYAIVLHAWQIGALILWTGFFLLRGDVSLSKVREATQAEPDAADGSLG